MPVKFKLLLTLRQRLNVRPRLQLLNKLLQRLPPSKLPRNKRLNKLLLNKLPLRLLLLHKPRLRRSNKPRSR